MNSAVTGVSRMMSMMSSPSKAPVRPRKVFCPKSWFPASNRNSTPSFVHPVNAREASRMSRSE